MDEGKFFTVPLDSGLEIRFERSKSNPGGVQVSLWEGDTRIALTYEKGDRLIKALEDLSRWQQGMKVAT